MRTPKPFDPVIIVWQDAEKDSNEQYDSIAAALAAYNPCIRRSVGFWVGWGSKDGNEAAMIATDDDRTSDFPTACGGISWIPKGMIRGDIIYTDDKKQ